MFVVFEVSRADRHFSKSQFINISDISKALVVSSRAAFHDSRESQFLNIADMLVTFDVLKPPAVAIMTILEQPENMLDISRTLSVFIVPKSI